MHCLRKNEFFPQSQKIEPLRYMLLTQFRNENFMDFMSLLYMRKSVENPNRLTGCKFSLSQNNMKNYI